MASSYILSDNGLSSGSAGLKSSAGNDGVLVLQTANSSGTATNAVYIDTAQDVGIGTNSPVANTRLHVHESANTISRIRLTNSTTTDASGKGLGVFQNGVDTYITNNEVGILAFSTSGTQRMQINAGAPILCLSGGNTSATGTGIAFPATQSASSDANTLDDYEEGSWTPTYIAGVTSPVYTGTGGVYRKVGSLVFVSGRIQLSGGAANGSNLQLGGLPFTAANAAGTQGALCIGYNGGFKTDGNVSLLIAGNSNYAEFYNWSGANFVGLNANNVQATLHFSGCYAAV